MWTSLSCAAVIGIWVVNSTLKRPPGELLYGPLLLAAFLLGYLFLGKRRDPLLVAPVYFLTTVGFVEIYRLRPELAIKQLGWIALGVLAMVLSARLLTSYNWIERYKYLLGTCALALLAITIIFGREVGGAKAWLRLGSWQFEPVEIVKVLLVLFLAGYLQENVTRRTLEPGWFTWGPMLIMWGLSILLLFLQRDLGAALLLIGIFTAMLYLATGNSLLVGGGLLFCGLAAWVSTMLFAHVRTRFEIWLHPWRYFSGSGYQIGQALFALASGGLTGRGLALGYPQFVPAAHTDFIFVAIAEELGLLGGVAVLCAFLFFVARGWQLASAREDRLGFLLVAGLVSILAIQALIIVGGNIRVIPLTGITLPFVSYGGSSLVSNYVLIGLILGVSSCQVNARKDLAV
jgi:cell division protein FtsW (lipid II flippase)